MWLKLLPWCSGAVFTFMLEYFVEKEALESTKSVPTVDSSEKRAILIRLSRKNLMSYKVVH